MSAASNRLRNGEPPAPRRKAARLSPELEEVLRMLKALEDQPDEDPRGPDRSR